MYAKEESLVYRGYSGYLGAWGPSLGVAEGPKDFQGIPDLSVYR